MISDPQSPPIVQQTANQQPFQTASLPQEIADAPQAQAPGMLQRSVPPWMQQRQQLPPAQPPMYRPRFDMSQMGGGYGGSPFGGGGWGGPPQMPQWAPPWMQQGGWGGYGMGMGGGGYGGGNPFGGYGPPGGGMGQGYQQPMYNPAAMRPAQIPQQPAAPQYRAPNGNTGIAGPLPAPQYNNQAVRPQPAGTVNQAAPAQAPAPQNRAAITPTPIYNRGNEMA